MTSALLMLLLLIKVQSVSSFPSCPASCAVCSEEALICQRLTSIINAAPTTQALLLNEGSISAVQRGDLSNLSNITVISLSHNRISALDWRSFRNMPLLQILLLDHNLLTLQVSDGGVPSNLTQLEVLALGSNRINMINSDWFQGTKSLRILKLDGNQITRLESGSFPLNGLRGLESLDLSDNLIDYVDKNSFRGLISLTTLDLSRNRLQSAPAQPLSYLTWLGSLNLDLNPWNCSCQLLELAAFLSEFLLEPDKTLYNGRRMVCVSADNPTVSTVLELTEANCVPSHQNITVRVASGSIASQLYVRDLAITGVVCFVGGVGLMLLIVFIYYKIHQKKKRREQQNQAAVQEEENTTVPNHIKKASNPAERRKDFTGANEATDAPVGSRTLGNGGQFRCPDCRDPMPTPVRWEQRNGRVETLEDRERRGIQVEEDRRRIGPPQRLMGREAMNRHLVGNSVTYEGQSRSDLLHCASCHRTYRPNQTEHPRLSRFPPRENSSLYGFQQPRPDNWGRNSIFSDFDLQNLKTETRNVTFALESPRKSQGGDGEGEETSPRARHDRKSASQSSRPIKVKLNLNPLRKSKVHPKLKGDEKSPRKSKDKSDKERKKDRKKSKKSEKEKASEKETSQEAAQVIPSNPMAHMQGFPGAQFRGGGMLLGNRTANLMGASGPQLPSSGLPFQGGPFVAQGKPMFPVANPMAHNMNLTGPIMGPGGTPAMGFMASPNLAQASPASFQANPTLVQTSANRTQTHVGTPQANVNVSQTNAAVSQSNTSAQASSSNTKQASSTLPAEGASQTGVNTKQAVSLSANSSSHNLQDLTASAPLAQSDPKSSPKSSTRVQPKSVQEPVLQSSNRTTETPTSPRKGSQTLAVGDSSQTVTPANTRTMVKNTSSTSLAESTYGDPKTGASQAERPNEEGAAVGADVSVSGVSGPSESGDNNMSSSLIQQEYLSEDGSSSPKRKLRLVIPEKMTNRPPTALEKKIR